MSNGSNGGGGSSDGGGDGEPRFLTTPPPGPVVTPKPALPNAPPPPMSPPTASGKRTPVTAAELIAGMASDPALRAAGVRLESSDLLQARRAEARDAFAASARWDRGNSWSGAWVEQRFGGLRIGAPGHWRFDPGEQRGATWEVPGGGLVSVQMFGFEKRAPTMPEYLKFLEDTDRKGFERVGVRAARHPHDDAPAGAAVEMFEHDPRPLPWPTRWFRLAGWSGTAILCARLDLDGLVPAELGADFARMWRGLR